MVEEIKQPTEPIAQPSDRITEAREVAERIEKATAELKLENARLEKLKSEDIIAGRSYGHVEQAPHVETPKEYAARIMRNDVK